mmetsp:Transcript_3394/g.8086  ORF Transcript_3394/g.8086 Transcript_3394/m.8086 type:complete len:215 (+) Transcript_3394:420-1064(+)
MSHTLAPAPEMVATMAASPPGLSDTVTAKRTRRRSAASPRSMTRPSTVMSMLPPHSGVTIFLPLSSGMSNGPPGNSAATPTAPPPSITAFSCSSRRRIEMATCFSETKTHLSTKCLATSNECGPTVGTARPSARVGVVTAGDGLPALSAAEKLAQVSVSTPMIWTSGRSDLMASATPAIRPAPPTGTTTTSTSGTCSRISSPMEPAPATIAGSS